MLPLGSESANSFLTTIATTGPGHITRCIYEHLSHTLQREGADFVNRGDVDQDIVIFPSDYFHAVPNSVRVALENVEERERLKDIYITENSRAVHWWQRSWQQIL